MGLEGSVVSQWPKAERRRNLALQIAKCHGKLLTTAHRLGIHRSHMYRLVEQYELWPVVNAARRERLKEELAERQRKYRGGMHV